MSSGSSSSASAGTVRYSDGAVYEGELARGLPHGRGVLVYADGARFDGEWCRDKRQGFGKEYYPPSGSVSHSGGALEEGRILFGESYEGEWEADRKHGNGTFRYASGDVFQGEYRHGKRDGQGVYTYARGEGCFEGEYRADLREGHGVETFPSGAVYDGQWSRDVKEGSGTHRHHTEGAHGITTVRQTRDLPHHSSCYTLLTPRVQSPYSGLALSRQPPRGRGRSLERLW